MRVDVIYNKSCQRMDELPNGSIDIVMTSPPYWGLRDYGDDIKEIWGGDKDCEHNWGNDILPKGNKSGPHGPSSTIGAKLGQDGARRGKGSNFCQNCGAWHGQLGLEPTFQLYLDHMMIVCAEVKRVLKKTGSFWMNMGDTYSSGIGRSNWDVTERSAKFYKHSEKRNNKFDLQHIPPKCLLGIPWRLVLRLIDEQDWILRNAIIWSKPNSMPSSVKDRLSNSYEFLFHLVKNIKPQYYWNEKTRLMADRKPPKAKQKEGIDWGWKEVGVVDKNVFNVRVRDADTDRFMEKATEGEKKNYGKSKLKKRTYWHSLGYWYDLDAIREKHKYPEDVIRRMRQDKEAGVKPFQKGDPISRHTKQDIIHKRKGSYDDPLHVKPLNPAGKNPADVWTITTQPCPEAHFATFPDKLCIKPILATCPAQLCKKCGKARVRIQKYTGLSQKDGWAIGSKTATHIGCSPTSSLITKQVKQFETIGWTSCSCNTGWDSGVLLDPFAGRGTALIMAKKLGRHYIGYELKKEYCEKLIKPALEEIDPLFSWKTPSPVAG